MKTSAGMAILFSISLYLLGTAKADPCEAALPKPGSTFGGEVTYVGDGDSFCVGAENGGIEVRLGDFNAPELRQAGGTEAKRALIQLAMGKWADCVADHPSYDRIVARCVIDGRSIGDLMRQAGIAEGGR